MLYGMGQIYNSEMILLLYLFKKGYKTGNPLLKVIEEGIKYFPCTTNVIREWFYWWWMPIPTVAMDDHYTK